MNLKDFAVSLIGQNPQVANNPNAQEMIRAIQNGDNVKGEQIARNLCDSYGITPDQAVQQAKRFFNLPF